MSRRSDGTFGSRLLGRGHRVFEAETGAQDLASAAADRPDAIVLDLGRQDLDGLDVIRQLREWTQTPIIVLSVRDREEVKVEALDAGADDYLTKPFGMGELLARIRVAVRHATDPVGDPVQSVGDLHIDFTRRQVTIAGRHVLLTPTEYDLLKVLISQPGRVLTHRHLVSLVGGPATRTTRTCCT